MSTIFSTTKKNNRWMVKKEGATTVSSTHSNQSDAWSEARRLARGADGDAILKGSGGRVIARNVYGKDPFPSKG